MEAVRRNLMLLVLSSFALWRSTAASAASYQQALEAYSDQRYAKSYKKAMSIAKEESGVRRSKALILAAAAVLELDKESKARVLFKKAMEDDPDLDLPDVVRSKRALRFFADVRDGRETSRTMVKEAEAPPAFGEFTTYLPFGLNSLVQEKYGLGFTLGAVQTFALVHSYTRYSQIQANEKKMLSTRGEAIRTGNDINPVYLDLEQKNKDFEKKSQQEIQLSIAAAIISYGYSVYDSGYHPPSRNRVTFMAHQSDRATTHFGLQIASSF